MFVNANTGDGEVVAEFFRGIKLRVWEDGFGSHEVEGPRDGSACACQRSFATVDANKRFALHSAA